MVKNEAYNFSKKRKKEKKVRIKFLLTNQKKNNDLKIFSVPILLISYKTLSFKEPSWKKSYKKYLASIILQRLYEVHHMFHFLKVE